METDGERRKKISVHIQILKEKQHYIQKAMMSNPFEMYSSVFLWFPLECVKYGGFFPKRKNGYGLKNLQW